MNMLHQPRDEELRAAVRRDLRDKKALQCIDTLVANTIDALIPDLDPLEHPNARWHPDDLMEVLLEQRRNIQAELQRVSCGGVVTIDDGD